MSLSGVTDIDRTDACNRPLLCRGMDGRPDWPYLWFHRTEAKMTKPPLTLLLAAPRGFCAGVDRAIKIVEMAIDKWGAPVYVRHEIVHNKFVVDSLRDRGAVFVEHLDEVPADRPVIFSAHGVPKAVPAEAARRQMVFVDATCPLVSKVHIEAERHHADGLQMVQMNPPRLSTMSPIGKPGLASPLIAKIYCVRDRSRDRLSLLRCFI